LISASPKSKGLLNAVIIESGGCTGSFFAPNDPKDGVLRYKEVLKAYNATNLDDLKGNIILSFQLNSSSSSRKIYLFPRICQRNNQNMVGRRIFPRTT